MTRSYANVSATLALVLALAGGTAVAAGKLGAGDIKPNAIRAKHIKDGQIRGAELAANAVTGADVADGAIAGSEVADGSIASSDVADESIDGEDVGANALGAADVDEESLQFRCRFSVASGEIGDLCYSAMVVPAGTLAEAERFCQGFNGRLPSVGEARLIHADLGNVLRQRTIWTDDYTSQSAAMVVSQSATGAITTQEIAETAETFYFCVAGPIPAATPGG